jgi:RNase P/RNase MRP subunit p29
MIDAWQEIGSATAIVRSPNSALNGRTGEIVAYAHGTVMIKLSGDEIPLPFGLGEISEIHETKGDALRMTQSKGMATFLAMLSAWAEANGTAGRTIVSDPDAGPGTMRWRAE